MPTWGQLEMFGEAAAKVVGESSAVERIVDEVMTTATQAASRESAAAPVSATARSLIESAVQRGDIPQGIYPNADRWANLRDPRTVTVEKSSFSTNRVWLKNDPPSGDGWKTTGVYLNGNRVGIFDRMSSIGKEQFPVQFRSVNLTLSDQTTVSIPERELQVIEKWNHEAGRTWPDKKLVLSNHPVRISPYTTLSFANASKLRQGAELITDFPFQRVGGELTNGVWRFPTDVRQTANSTNLLFHFPINRPEMLATNLSKVPDEYYQQFLQSLEGKTLGEATLPDWIKFDGSRAPMASQDVLVTARPRVIAPSIAPPREFRFPKNVYFDRLAGGKSVTVDSVDVTQHNVTLKLDPRNGAFLDQGVYVDGNRVGIFDQQGGLTRDQLPGTINKTTVKLSDGRELSVSDRTLRVVKDWGTPDSTGRWNPTSAAVFDSAPIDVSPLDRLSFAKAETLKPGKTFAFDHPFQVVDGKVTDGLRQFPIQRAPRQNSLVPPERWQEFLDALKGKRAGEAVLPAWVRLSDEPAFADIPRIDESILIKERPSFHVGSTDFSSQLRPTAPPAILRRLTNGETVTVDSVTVSQNDLSLRYDPPSGEWLDQGVYLNGERVGAYNCNSGICRNEFPLSVPTAHVTLSNGETMSVSQRALRVVEDWGQPKSDVYDPKYKTVLSTQPIRMSRWESLPFQRASELKSGDQFTRRYPFQWVDDRLTNGTISLPRVRPEGAEWKQYPIPAVQKGYYDSYLKTLEGKFVDDVLESHPRIMSGIKTERELVRQATLTPRQFEMWNGLLGDGKKLDYVSLSQGIIFKYPVEAGKTIYVVDNPGSGAVYLFKDYADAEKLATGYRDIGDAAVEGKGARTIAREAGNRFVIHKGDWKEKLLQAIGEMSDEVSQKAS